MSDFENLPANPDILSIPQEQVVMLVAAMATGIERAKLDPAFFDFSYVHVDTTTVRASFTGRAYATDGRRGIWSGTKTMDLIRARLNRTTTPIQLTVAYRQGMTMEHVLRALQATYSFNVTSKELLLKDSNNQYVPFVESLRPPAMTLELKFANNQARIVPTGSEFTIKLDNSGRPDINDYLQVIKAGSVLGGL